MTAGQPRLRWVALGLLILQVGWILALPPFRGIDEFDHVYRASAVADGEWVSEPEAATRGTGATVSVSRAIVEAARPECERLPYTGPEDCVGSPDGSRVEIASGAGRYHPFYYAAVGYPALLFDGVSALYAMRIVSALLCLLLALAALDRLRRWARPRTVLATSVGLTPMVVYSTSVVAPNGLEMVAGLAFWVALAGLAHDPDLTRERGHLVLGLVSGGLLVSVRSLGPLWALLVLVTALVAWPALRARLWELASTRRGRLVMAVAALICATSLGWILLQRSLVIGVEDYQRTFSLGFRLAAAAEEVPLWLLQTIAAFPLRNEPAPTIVYCCYGVILGFLVLGAWRRGGGGARGALAIAILLSLAIPFAITAATLNTFGTAWQGRYVLPYLIGTALISGLVWESRQTAYGWRFLAPGLVLVVIGQVAGPVAVLASELQHSPVADTDLWAVAPSPWLLGALATVGALCVTVPLFAAVREEGHHEDASSRRHHSVLR